MGFFKRSDVKTGDEGRKDASKEQAPAEDSSPRLGIVSGVLSSPRDSEEETLFGNVVERRFGPGSGAPGEPAHPPLEIDAEPAEPGAFESRPFEGPALEVDSMANIGRSTTITGQIVAEEDLEIQGRVEGRVHLANHQLTVGSDGVVQADVEAHSVIVIGRVTGNIVAEEVVEVKSGGFIGGDVKAPRVIMADGAIVVGGLDMSAALSSEGLEKPREEPERPVLKKVEDRADAELSSA